MNFQFSGSIPNVHWHSNSNVMSTQSVTEFTIINGRVTVTRAANDARNDVNVTIVANGRRNENPRRNCLCHREVRWRNRRRQGLNGLLRSIHDLKDNVYDATDDLAIARRKLQDMRDELQKVMDEVYKGRSNLHKATTELNKAVGDLQAPELHNLNERESNILRMDLLSAENDIMEARRHIREAEDDLTIELELMEEMQRSSNARTLNAVAASDTTSTANTSTNSLTMDNRNKCSVCLERTVNSVLYKCGHMCMCFICALKVRRYSENKSCPVCRTEITDVIRTYVS